MGLALWWRGQGVERSSDVLMWNHQETGLGVDLLPSERLTGLLRVTAGLLDLKGAGPHLPWMGGVSLGILGSSSVFDTSSRSGEETPIRWLNFVLGDA